MGRMLVEAAECCASCGSYYVWVVHHGIARDESWCAGCGIDSRESHPPPTQLKGRVVNGSQVPREPQERS